MSAAGAERELDPYIDACDSWCMDAEQGHRLEFSQDDQRHWGEEARVPVPLNTGEPGYVPTLRVYLERKDREVEARILVLLDEAELLHLRLQDAPELREVLNGLLAVTQRSA